MNVKKAAQILGQKARGKAKKITPSDRLRRRRQMLALNALRHTRIKGVDQGGSKGVSTAADPGA